MLKTEKFQSFMFRAVAVAYEKFDWKVWYFVKVVAKEKWSFTKGGHTWGLDCNTYAVYYSSD